MYFLVLNEGREVLIVSLVVVHYPTCLFPTILTEPDLGLDCERGTSFV